MRGRYGDDVVDAWKATSLKAVKVGKKKWETPFRSKTSGSYIS